MLISVPGGVRAGADAVLGLGDARDRRVPDLPRSLTRCCFFRCSRCFAVFGDWTGIQLINRWYVLLIIYPTLTVPFCTWIMIGYFASIPKELDEAAIIDGASWFQTLTRDLYSGRAARPDRRDHLRLHASPGRNFSIRWCSRPRPISWCCRSASSPR